MSVEEQVVTIFAGTRGYLDPIPVEDVRRFEDELLEWFRSRHAEILTAIRTDGNIPDEDAFVAAVVAFADQFQPSATAVDEPDAEEQGDAQTRMAGGRREGILPEEEVSRADGAGD
jgi:hypothetical protein